MAPRAAIDHAFRIDRRRRSGTSFARRDNNGVLVTRARILIAGGLAIAMAVMAVVVWLDSANWKELLLFGSIVTVAAVLGQGRESRVVVLRRRDGDGDMAKYRKNQSLGTARF